MKMHILGASGSGVTTLGEALATRLDYIYLDVDHYYWIKTDPPFQQKAPIPQRQEQILADTKQRKDWILGGSLVSWGDFIRHEFELVVYLDIPKEIRMNRLRLREQERYSEALKNPSFQKESAAFLEWASHYDDPPESGWAGRSRYLHKQWMDSLDCPIVKLVGDLSVQERVDLVLSHISSTPSRS